MTRVIRHLPAGTATLAPSGHLTLDHEARHLRRKLLTLDEGGDILVDFPAAISLDGGDRLELKDGRQIEIIAAREALYEVRAPDRSELIALAWHLGNRHLPAQIEEDRILIGRDHVIRDMLLGLGATVTEIEAPFSPVRGAYHSHGHAHAHHGHPHG